MNLNEEKEKDIDACLAAGTGNNTIREILGFMWLQGASTIDGLWRERWRKRHPEDSRVAPDDF